LDATDKGHTGLAPYYTKRGESPGVWVGSGMDRIDGLIGAREFEKAPRLFTRPGQHLSLALLGNLYELSSIAVDQFLTDCRMQR
jgi:hypothetical protein